MDIHNYKRRLERTIERINQSSISQENKDTIMKFHDSCFTEGLSICKIERYLYDAHKLAEMFGKDLTKATKEDLQKIVVKIEKNEWSPHTKHSFKIMIRKLYRCIDGIYEKGVYPERVRWLHSNVKNNHQKLPEELLTEDEIKQMINYSEDARDRALISVLYESGCRISEIGSLMIKDITFDEYGAKITVLGKTGSRRIRLINSTPYLQEWINKHPQHDISSNYVWINKNNKKALSYARLSHILKRIAKRAGIKKEIYPHLFRHSRATFLAKHLTEAQMKDYLGWTQSSKMAAIYVHLSGRDTDDAILKLNGLKIDEDIKEKDKLKPKECLRCKTQNEPTNKFCKLCGFVLDEEVREELMKEEMKRNRADDLMEELVNDKDVLKLLVEKIQSLRNKNP